MECCKRVGRAQWEETQEGFLALLGMTGLDSFSWGGGNVLAQNDWCHSVECLDWMSGI